jgi:hypothetical protein
MKIVKSGKPWSAEVECGRCRSLLRLDADAIEYCDVKQSISGIGVSCPVCQSKQHIAFTVPPVVEEIVKKRKGLAPRKPEVIRQGQPQSFPIICSVCEAELLVERGDIRQPKPGVYRIQCGSCRSAIDIPPRSVPEHIKETLAGKA